MTRASRAEKAARLEDWAQRVGPDELATVDTSVLRRIADLAQAREDVDAELTKAVAEARTAKKSWSEIGAMLGVSKQAAQRKFGQSSSAA